MRYLIVYKKAAEKELLHLPGKYARKIHKTINNLSETPRPHGCKKLTGSVNEYRIRIGNYRILYTVSDDVLTVYVIKIAHRKDVYR